MESGSDTGPSAQSVSRKPTEAESRFLRELEEAIRQRNATYKLVFLITMAFENDDTNARSDCKAFAKYMKDVFGLKDTNVLEIIFPEDQDAAIYFSREIVGKFNQIEQSCVGKKLLLLHFAGHGTLDSSNQLVLRGNLTDCNQELPWELVRITLLDPRRLRPRGEVDVACVLDCCHSGAFFRPNMPSSMTVEVLAATGETSTTTARKSQNIEATFTQRFISEMRMMISEEEKSRVTFPEIFKKIQRRKRESSKSLPVYRMLYGETPILLPIKSQQLLQPSPIIGKSNSLDMDNWRPKVHSVALKVRIKSEINEESTRTMIRWLHQLRGDYQIEVTAVNETNSTVVFLTVPYTNLYIMYRLEMRGLFKVDVICENLYSRNLLDEIINLEVVEAT
ncbi:hypothetical protein TWF730_003023 [Orbilia blumenaviensis]|uniref:Peptidase C14 caspase domain-containing protein n=1 Tax=Orbilia blumenaviensis TaxID=1796055 RepID=A0AAV9U807_9PEZI